MKTEAASYFIPTGKICQFSAVLQTADFFSWFVFFFLRIFYLLREKGEASETLHRATFESLHRQRFNLCPAHCQPLTRLRILSVLPSLTWLPLKSSHSHTRLCLKQVNTHILAASRTLTPDWLWIPDKEPSLWISKCCLFEHVGMTHVLVLRGSRQAGWLGVQPPWCGGSYWGTELDRPNHVAIDFILIA